MDDNKKTHKLTDEQFIDALRQCHGILSLVVTYVQQKHGISYTRQSVYERAKNFMDELKQIRETIIDLCEARLIKVVADDSADVRLAIKVALYLLNFLGRDRGYGKNGTDKVLHARPEQVYKIGGKIIRF